MLIAGFSCVDFSALNNERKNLEQRGESGDTFFSMREYAKEYRPKVIILENVMTAPWADPWLNPEAGKRSKGPLAPLMPSSERGLDYHMGEVGYACRHLLLDTKSYYIPHTRKRGYMVCVDRSSLTDGMDVELMLNQWANLVKKLRRPASVPVEAMLLKADDPKLFDSQEPEKDQAGVPWKRCEIGHRAYRRDLKLGDGRPLTEWSNDSSFRLPDFVGKMSGLTPRVLDTLDIAHLRNVRRGFDDRYYRYQFPSMFVSPKLTLNSAAFLSYPRTHIVSPILSRGV